VLILWHFCLSKRHLPRVRDVCLCGAYSLGEFLTKNGVVDDDYRPGQEMVVVVDRDDSIDTYIEEWRLDLRGSPMGQTSNARVAIVGDADSLGVAAEPLAEQNSLLLTLRTHERRCSDASP
jgi:hypothetical protein